MFAAKKYEQVTEQIIKKKQAIKAWCLPGRKTPVWFYKTQVSLKIPTNVEINLFSIQFGRTYNLVISI